MRAHPTHFVPQTHAAKEREARRTTAKPTFDRSRRFRPASFVSIVRCAVGVESGNESHIAEEPRCVLERLGLRPRHLCFGIDLFSQSSSSVNEKGGACRTGFAPVMELSSMAKSSSAPQKAPRDAPLHVVRTTRGVSQSKAHCRLTAVEAGSQGASSKHFSRLYPCIFIHHTDTVISFSLPHPCRWGP